MNFIFAENLYKMETKHASGKYWIYFFIWLAIMVFMLADSDFRQFFWLALPGVVTHFAKALDLL